MNLNSKFFSYQEMIKSPSASRLGIDNNIYDPNHQRSMQTLVTKVLDPTRKLIRKPITINSGYRCVKLNTHIGGVASSQHCLGEAADIECPSISNFDLAKIIAHTFDFDQIILEFWSPEVPDSGWVHVSYREGRLRKQVLRAVSHNGRTTYEPFFFH